jgi:hypothetical protein
VALTTRWFSDFSFSIIACFNNTFLLFSVPLCLCVPLTVFSFILFLAVSPPQLEAATWKCAPTPWDEIGPFYSPNAPLRSKIGSGYVLEGTVRSAATCRPVPGARIEFWQAGPDGEYSDAWRATIISDRRGRYRLTTSFPPPYARRPSHIHILVDMRGYAGLITQHYPVAGKRRATFDLIMETE